MNDIRLSLISEPPTMDWRLQVRHNVEFQMNIFPISNIGHLSLWEGVLVKTRMSMSMSIAFSCSCPCRGVCIHVYAHVHVHFHFIQHWYEHGHGGGQEHEHGLGHGHRRGHGHIWKKYCWCSKSDSSDIGFVCHQNRSTVNIVILTCAIWE